MAKIANIVKLKQEKFATHYAEFSNATRAYLYANPKAAYSTARVEGCKYLAHPNIAQLIESKQAEFNEKFMHSKEKTIQELIQTAEQAKKANQFGAYGKLREMVIKICGFYEPEKIEQTGTIIIKFDGDDDNE